ncbi:vacuolar protein sorting-associated protein 13 [Caerostris extrusa]|uniref:Vacuolar protein sorting-associated protein 13 n=1 Tax=Caerostris extrusa TaxID=172846 RepID=A0AAV4MA51_CAEEX|nr:vacuolar protein sorting-associated protein 13 [Caerostris extrusa]
MTSQINAYERDLDLFNITMARKQAELEVTKQIEEAMTADEKQKLYEAIGYHEQPVVTEYPKEFVENKLLFLLHNLTVTLSDDTKSEPQVLKVTVNNLVEVFKPPEKAAIQQLQATAMLKLEDLKEMSAFGLQYAIEQHKYLDLKVDAQPLFIVIPEKGVLEENSSLIVVSLGNFKMNSHKRSYFSKCKKSCESWKH